MLLVPVPSDLAECPAVVPDLRTAEAVSQHHQLIKNDPRWKQARQDCFERDDWTCVECGSTEDLQADHDPVPLWRCMADDELLPLAFDVDNLVTRCGPRANGCNQKRGGDDGQPLVRQLWINPKYPELIGVVGPTTPTGS